MTDHSERPTVTERLRLGILLACTVLLQLAAAWGSAGWDHFRHCWDRILSPNSAMAAHRSPQESRSKPAPVAADSAQ